MAEHIPVDVYRFNEIDLFPSRKYSFAVGDIHIEEANVIHGSGLPLYGKIVQKPSGLNVNGDVFYTPSTVTTLVGLANG